MAQVSGVFGALSDQVIKTIVDFTKMGMSELPLMHPKFYKKKTTTRKFERMQSIAPFGDVPAKAEGSEYSFDIIQPGYSKDITPREYGLGFLWSETSMEDDDFEVLSQYARWLGFSMRVLQETLAAYPFNNAFSASTTADGLALSHTAHTLKRGGTASNKLAAASDLSFPAVQQMRADMRANTKLESGQLVRPASSVYLWCHPNDEWNAHRIVKATGIPGSADNDPNPAKDLMDITPAAWEYLTDTDAWGFLAKQQSAHGLCQVTRLAPKLNPQGVDWKTGNRIVTIRSREVFEPFDWRNFAATQGA